MFCKEILNNVNNDDVNYMIKKFINWCFWINLSRVSVLTIENINNHREILKQLYIFFLNVQKDDLYYRHILRRITSFERYIIILLFRNFSTVLYASKYFRLLHELKSMILIQYYVLITFLFIKATSFKKCVIRQT